MALIGYLNSFKWVPARTKFTRLASIVQIEQGNRRRYGIRYDRSNRLSMGDPTILALARIVGDEQHHHLRETSRSVC